MKFIAFLAIIWASGFVVCMNLSQLLEVAQYDAAWWKVGVAAFLAVGAGCWAKDSLG